MPTKQSIGQNTSACLKAMYAFESNIKYRISNYLQALMTAAKTMECVWN